MAATPHQEIRLFHGIDIIEIAKMKALLSDDRSDFRERCFTSHEIASAQKDDQLAGWFAAKEAVMKALGTGWTNGIGWKEVEIIHEDGGKPNLSLKGRAREIADHHKIRAWAISISHSENYAVASVVATS